MEKTYHVDSNTLIYASQDQNGEISQWLNVNRPYTNDVVKHECLERWPKINSPEKTSEKKFLERIFAEAKQEGRYIETNWRKEGNPYEIRAQELQSHGIKERDSYIAIVAEQKGHILVTADNKNDFGPRLEKLNQQGDGNFNFKLQTYQYHQDGRHLETFKQWNQAKKANTKSQELNSKPDYNQKSKKRKR
jgi:predicted nucleic acid-binding protein